MLVAHKLTRVFFVFSVAVAVCGVSAFTLSYASASTSQVTDAGPPMTAVPLAAVAEKAPATEATTNESEYFEVAGSCGPYFGGAPCLNMRSGPGASFPVVDRLRNGVVLKIASTTLINGQPWDEIGFDGSIRYPKRVASSWYVNASSVHPFFDPGLQVESSTTALTTKSIVIRISAQMLYAYDGTTLVMKELVSTGLNGTPTPLGTFHVYRKLPDSYMQGPVPGISPQYYDLPGVPWDLYFTAQGAAIHGAYWHNHFGEKWSHGCVNLPTDVAKILYEWAPLGTPVVVEP